MFTDFKSISLNILVFGPSPDISGTGFDADLSRKRRQIRDALNGDGHRAVFPEDLMHGAIDPAIDNAYLWEQVLVREYDMVVNLVGSYGAVDELSLFHRDNLALKAALFFSDSHTVGLAYQHALALKEMGACLHTYSYPTELTSCSLMTRIREKVRAVRIGKFLGT